jgi:dihydroorotase
MSKYRTAYLNARLVDPASGLDAAGGLLAEDGVIADVGEGLFAKGAPKGAEIVDCGGMVLAPGLVDMRVQLRDPGHEHMEDIGSAGLAAAAGGVTTMVCLPNTEPVIDNVAVLEFVARRAREVKLAKIHCYATATRGMQGAELTEFGLLGEAGAVAFTDAETAIADAKTMQRALSYATTFGHIIVQHPEEPALCGDGAMNSGEIASRLGLSGLPPVAEVMMIERDLRLVEATGGRWHAAHVSTTASVDAIRQAKKRGLNVTCDTAPHYFALNEVAVGDYRTFAKVRPPLRGEDDRQAIVEGLRDGTIDAIASDHSPHDQDSKRQPFAQASFGIIGLETLLPLTLELYHNKHLSLSDALALVTCKPAALLGLAAGRLAKGAQADLALIDPDRPWKIDEDAFRSKSKNSPFDGRPVQGHALRTVVDGRAIFIHGEEG